MRFSDIIMSVPGILLAIVIVAIFGNGVLELFIALVIVLIPRFIRFSHSITSRINTELYITIAKVTGSSKIQILKNEILPNSKNLLMQQSILSFSEVILEISALGFLGLGIPAPLPEWGAMLAESRNYFSTNPYLIILPGLCLMLVVLFLNYIGENLTINKREKNAIKN